MLKIWRKQQNKITISKRDTVFVDSCTTDYLPYWKYTLTSHLADQKIPIIPIPNTNLIIFCIRAVKNQNCSSEINLETCLCCNWSDRLHLSLPSTLKFTQPWKEKKNMRCKCNRKRALSVCVFLPTYMHWQLTNSSTGLITESPLAVYWSAVSVSGCVFVCLLYVFWGKCVAVE